MDNLLSSYVPILIFLLLAVVIAIFLFVLGFLVSPFSPNAAKNSSYECGFPAVSDARGAFDIRFYLVAISFIVFDVETVLLFPWAVSIRFLSLMGVFSMLLFLMILIVAFAYEWSQGALNWE